MFVIGVTGLSCSGKTTFSQRLLEALGPQNCLLISMDNYYKELTEDEYKILYSDNSHLNFDRPEAVDLQLMFEQIHALKQGDKCVKLPVFDLGRCVITGHVEVPANHGYKYLIVEGIMIFSKREIAQICDLKVWVDTLEYICALRRLMKYAKDIEGYSFDYVYNQAVKFVIPGQEKYVKPAKLECDLIVNNDKMDLNMEIVIGYLKKKSIE